MKLFYFQIFSYRIFEDYYIKHTYFLEGIPHYETIISHYPHHSEAGLMNWIPQWVTHGKKEIALSYSLLGL